MSEAEQLSMLDGSENIFRRHMKKHDPNEAKYAKQHFWMSLQQREYPMPYTPYKIGCYIRYVNQTEHENYLEYHKNKHADSIALCPNWTLVDFYVDEGSRAPRMENAPEWCRLLTDCFNGKVNLIVTQNASFISRKPEEMIFISRILASHGVGLYIISEDIFTLASYFRYDMFERLDWNSLPEDELDMLPMEKKLRKIEGGR